MPRHGWQHVRPGFGSAVGGGRPHGDNLHCRGEKPGEEEGGGRRKEEEEEEGDGGGEEEKEEGDGGGRAEGVSETISHPG